MHEERNTDEDILPSNMSQFFGICIISILLMTRLPIPKQDILIIKLLCLAQISMKKITATA